MPIGRLISVLIVGAGLLAIAGSVRAQVPSSAQLANPELETTTGRALKPGANSFAESQARALLEAKGYLQVSGLVNDREGIWRGTALKDDRPFEVSVDFQGHVQGHASAK